MAWSPSDFSRKCFRLPSRWGWEEDTWQLPPAAWGDGRNSPLRDLPTWAARGCGSLPSSPHLQIEDTCPS